MTDFDIPYEEMVKYKPRLTMEDDFHSFWNDLKSASACKPLQSKIEEGASPYKDYSFYRIQYDGLDGSPVYGWYIVPNRSTANEPIPVIVRYHGYTGDNLLHPHQLMVWAALGVAVLSIDVRGQVGDTPDPGVYVNSDITGWVTKGLPNRDNYYYKQVYMDCLRAIDFVCERPEIDPTCIAVYGESQGGGLALVVAGLDSRPKLLLTLIPFLAHWKRAFEISKVYPYQEITQWFEKFDPDHLQEEQVFRMLSYFDAMNMAPQVKAQTFFGITLQDVCCPPSTGFATYNHLSSPKELIVLPDYGHVGGIPAFINPMLNFLRDKL